MVSFDRHCLFIHPPMLNFINLTFFDNPEGWKSQPEDAVWLQLVNTTHMSNVALHNSLNSASPQRRIRRHPFQANVACDFESRALSRKHPLNPEDAIPTKETWPEVQDEAGSGYACLTAGYTTLCCQTFTRGGDRIRLKSEQSMDSHQFFADACGATYLCRVNPTHTISVLMDGLSGDI